MFTHCTDEAQRAITRAEDLARELNHSKVDTGHLLIGLAIKDKGPGPGSIAWQVLRLHGLDNVVTLRVLLQEIRPRGTFPPTSLRPTGSFKSAMDYAAKEAHGMNHAQIGAEHLLLGLLRQIWGGASYNGCSARSMLCDELGVTTGSQAFDALRPTVIRLIAQYRAFEESRLPVVNPVAMELLLMLDPELLSTEQLSTAIGASAEARLALVAAGDKLDKLGRKLYAEQARRNER